MNKEILAKARAAKSPEELLKIAHENGMQDFTEENAKAYFEAMHRSGELADEEMDVSAGGCRKGGYRVVSRGNICSAGLSSRFNDYYAFTKWKCKTCKEEPGDGYNLTSNYRSKVRKTCSCNRRTLDDFSYAFGVTADFEAVGACGSCDWCKYVGGVWICTEPYDVC